MPPANPTPLAPHLVALIVAPPLTAAIAVAVVTLLLAAEHPVGADMGRIALIMFGAGALVGYVVQLACFIPLYALLRRRWRMNVWTTTLIGAVSGAAATAIGARLLDDASLMNAAPWLTMLGALGGLIYSRALRLAAPLSGLSGS